MAALRRIACLLLREMAPEQEPGSVDDLLEIALAHSPRVEAGGPDLVYLDVAGLHGLWGDEGEIGRRLVRSAADRGLQVRVGIAGSRIAALVAARRGDDATVVEPGRDAEYLASAPLSTARSLRPDGGAASHMGNTDPGRAGGLAGRGLVREARAAKAFVSTGSRAARTLVRSNPGRRRPCSRSRSSRDGRWRLSSRSAISWRGSSNGFAIGSRDEGSWADQFQWTCRLTDRTAHDGSFTPAVPMNEPAAVTALLRASLESRPPRGAVEAVTLRARPVRVAPAQESLTERSRSSPRMLAAMLARLAAVRGRATDRRCRAPGQLSSRRGDDRALSASAADLFREKAEWRGLVARGARAAAAPAAVPRSRDAHRRPSRPCAIGSAHRADRGERGAVARLGGVVDRAPVDPRRVGRGARRRDALPARPRRLRVVARRHLRLMALVQLVDAGARGQGLRAPPMAPGRPTGSERDERDPPFPRGGGARAGNPRWRARPARWASRCAIGCARRPCPPCPPAAWFTYSTRVISWGVDDVRRAACSERLQLPRGDASAGGPCRAGRPARAARHRARG